MIGGYTDPLHRFAGWAADPEKQVKYFEEGKAYTLQLEATSVCKQECVYCYSKSTPSGSGELSSSDVKRVLEEAASLGIRAIEWLGGDPLERPDWQDLLSYATDLGLENNVPSSGIPLANPAITDAVIEQSAYLGIHLDSLDSNFLSRLRRGNARKIMEIILKGVDLVLEGGKDPNYFTNITTATSLQPSSDIINTITWFMEEKKMRTVVSMFSPAGFADHRKEWGISKEDRIAVYEARNEICYPGSVGFGPCGLTKFYCGTIFCLTYTGDVTACSNIRDKSFGNIYEQSLTDIYENNKKELLWLSLRGEEGFKLTGCSTCEKREVCFGCRSCSHYYTGSDLNPDPNCWQNIQEEER